MGVRCVGAGKGEIQSRVRYFGREDRARALADLVASERRRTAQATRGSLILTSSFSRQCRLLNPRHSRHPLPIIKPQTGAQRFHLFFPSHYPLLTTVLYLSSLWVSLSFAVDSVRLTMPSITSTKLSCLPRRMTSPSNPHPRRCVFPARSSRRCPSTASPRPK